MTREENVWTVCPWNEIEKDLSWKWLVQGNLKVQTEAMICAAQEQASRTKSTKHKIDKTLGNPLRRMCGGRRQTLQHMICECKNLAQRGYKTGHDTVAKLDHWKLCKKHNLERWETWYEHCSKAFVEEKYVKLIWDITLQSDNVMEARTPT